MTSSPCRTVADGCPASHPCLGLAIAALAAWFSTAAVSALRGEAPDGCHKFSRYAHWEDHRDRYLRELEGLNSRVTYGCNVHEVDPTDWLNQCAYFFKLGGFQPEGSMFPRYSTYYLKEKESGLCTMTLSAAFVNMEYSESVQQALQDHDLMKAEFAAVEGMLPTMALPALMSFPQTALDVVEVVKFANRHNMLVSVKNSGHSYSGQSTRRNSIQLNMRAYPVYSKIGIYECDSVELGHPAAAPCRLAVARGKGAVARVGGGEGNDDVLRNLASWNFALPRKHIYQAMMGSSGMVGAGGGWFLGGGLGGGQSRMWGVGSDQVVWLEMVLPDGTHVKFGPTQWEKQEGLMYPQTTRVEGLCNHNVQHRESQWQWGGCTDKNINFDDLWFAVRGGGGGSWGVVLSVYYQLHEIKSPTFTVNTDFDVVSALQAAIPNQTEWAYVKMRIQDMWTDFLIDFLWKPSALGVADEISDSCGYTGTGTAAKSPWDIFGQTSPAFRHNFMITCYANNAHEALIEAWKKYVPTSRYLPHAILSEGIQRLLTSCMISGGYMSQKLVGIVAGAPIFCFNEPLRLAPEHASLPKKEMDEFVLSVYSQWIMNSPLGQLSDIPGSGTHWPYGWSAILPVSMITEHDRDWIVGFLQSKVGFSHHAMGGKQRIASDGKTVQPKGYREAAMQVMFTSNGNHTEFIAMISEVSGMVLKFLGIPGQGSADGFPGFTEMNHQPGRFAGPLKSDWRIPCPLDFTMEQRWTQCMSVQETVWGTTNLKRLEAVKDKLDPRHLFTVHFGVGNKDVVDAVI